jgi:hypothetical protein
VETSRRRKDKAGSPGRSPAEAGSGSPRADLLTPSWSVTEPRWSRAGPSVLFCVLPGLLARGPPEWSRDGNHSLRDGPGFRLEARDRMRSVRDRIVGDMRLFGAVRESDFLGHFGMVPVTRWGGNDVPIWHVPARDPPSGAAAACRFGGTAGAGLPIPGVNINPPARWHFPLHLCHRVPGGPNRPYLRSDPLTRQWLAAPAATPAGRAGGLKSGTKWHSFRHFSSIRTPVGSGESGGRKIRRRSPVNGHRTGLGTLKKQREWGPLLLCAMGAGLRRQLLRAPDRGPGMPRTCDEKNSESAPWPGRDSPGPGSAEWPRVRGRLSRSAGRPRPRPAWRGPSGRRRS